MTILETHGLTKSFDGVIAVDEVDLVLEKGEVRGLIGPNGAGKTTLLNLITGNLKPTKGEVYIRGEDVTGLPPYKIAQRGIGRTFQIPNLFWELSVGENILGVTQLASSKRKALEKQEEIMDLVGLKRKRKILVAELSHGDQKLLEIALALGACPRLLLLDEPTSGLSEQETDQMVKVIGKIDQTIILVEHDFEVVSGLSDLISVLDRGEIIFEGTPDQVQKDEEVKSIYLKK